MQDIGRHDLADLIYLMSRLRDPETGCPWDLKQDYASLVNYTLEEVYEVVDTIEQADFEHLKEELGDLLFQVVFYCQIAQEEGRFEFGDVVHQIVTKLVRRHPHVFPEGTLQSRRLAGSELCEEKIKSTWENLKQEEREDKGKASILADIPKSLPAVVRAQKLQKRAAGVGFDWSCASDVLPKIHEELDELSEALESGDTGQVAEEFGDLVFSCINLGRHLGLNVETELRRGNAKFEHRFQQMESLLSQEDAAMGELSPEQWEVLWEKAKNL